MFHGIEKILTFSHNDGSAGVQPRQFSPFAGCKHAACKRDLERQPVMKKGAGQNRRLFDLTIRPDIRPAMGLRQSGSGRWCP